MKKIKLYQVDEFTDRLFSGNPAAICMLDKWNEDGMQAIANENNLAEKAMWVRMLRIWKMKDGLSRNHIIE